MFPGKPAWLLHLPWKEASNTQLQFWPFQNVTVQTGKQHTMNSFIVVGVFYWAAVVWKELLPVSSLGHLDYGSMSYDLGWDIYEWYLLFHGGAVLRGMGTF